MFKTIVEKSLSQRLLVLAAAIVLVLTAPSSCRRHRWMSPDLNKPTVTLMTEAGGMAPEEVEALITFPSRRR